MLNVRTFNAVVCRGIELYKFFIRGRSSVATVPEDRREPQAPEGNKVNSPQPTETDKTQHINNKL